MAQGTRAKPVWVARLERYQPIVFPVTLLASLGIFVLPLPTFVMDLMLSGNIGLSVLILLATVTARTPLEFTVFPTVLLATTLFRLVLNVATTRLIIVNAATEGEYAAGHVVRAFGEFVAQGNLVLGIIIFVILVVINWSVINRGTTRTSEVAARFALDGMPGRQMAVDADLNAGLIDEKEAKRRRDEITAQADFYGAIDGASKFVRGDAIAGVIIILINIIGGLSVGTLYYGMEVAEAAEVYTKLTIGDGLVSQIPGMLLSISAGFLVTRQSTPVNLSTQLGRQVLTPNVESLFVASGFMGLLALSGLFGTGLPVLPMGLIASACALGGFGLRNQTKRVEQVRKDEEKKKQQVERTPPERVEDVLRLDTLELEVGYGLIPMADRRKGGDLEDRIVLIRRELAADLGMILPGVRMHDNPRLAPNDYQIRLKGGVVARGTAYPGHYFAVDPGTTSGPLQGIRTTDPCFEHPAYWIDPSQRERAEMLGYMVVDSVTVLTNHLRETIKKNASELLNRDRVSALINVVKESSPALVNEVIPEVLRLGDVQRVLQNLLRERVSIRDMETILETLGDYGPKTKDPDILTEYVRHRLSRTICQGYRDSDRVMQVVTLDPSLEDMIAAGIDHADRMSIKLSPTVIEGIGRAILAEVKKLLIQGRDPIVLVGPQCRAGLKHMMMPLLPNLVVLSYNEITRDTKIESVGMVTYSAPTRAAVGAAS